jgi:hypothetical protein
MSGGNSPQERITSDPNQDSTRPSSPAADYFARLIITTTPYTINAVEQA